MAEIAKQAGVLHPVFQQALAPFIAPASQTNSALDEFGGDIVEADKRLQAAQGATAQAKAPESEVDRAISVLMRVGDRLTDRQLTSIGDVFREALCSAEDGSVCRRYDCDGLDELLADAREFDPDPIGPDYECIDAPYVTEREQAALDDRAAHAYGAERLGEPSL